jgi:hypothetical protein
MFVAACGSTPSAGNPTQAATATRSTPPPAATTTSGSTALIQTAMATINGTSETVLTNAQGRTLYYR